MTTDTAPLADAIYTPDPVDEASLIDLSAPSDDINGLRAGALGVHPLRFKLYGWQQVEAALLAGAKDEEEAKRGLTPYVFELKSIGDGLSLAHIGADGRERATCVLSVDVDGRASFELFDEVGDTELPSVTMKLGAPDAPGTAVESIVLAETALPHTYAQKLPQQSKNTVLRFRARP